MDSVYLEKVKGLINRIKDTRASLTDIYIPEIIHSITWKDAKPSAESKEVRF
jgi:hypothetical protein